MRVSRSSLAAPLAAALVGAIAFALQGGLTILDPTDVGWMPPGSDWSYHYVGWVYYRHADLQLFPLGAIPGLQYPVGTTVGFNDGIPWLALVLRFLSPLLPATFQYIGLWLLLCFLLIGWFGVRLVQALAPTVAPVTAALGGALFTLSPALMMRVQHEALCAHFLILAALLLCVRPARLWPRAAPAFLTAVAVGVHPYLGAMVAVLAVAAVARLRQERRVGVLAAAGLAALVPAVYLGCAFWLGYLLGTSGDRSATGFGNTSVDLATLIDPGRDSWIFPSLHFARGVDAATAYLGAGFVLLGLAAIVVTAAARARGEPPLPWRPALPLLVATSALTVYAVSPVVTLFGEKLLDLSWLYRLVPSVTGAFRVAGRFVWPLLYVLIAGAVAILVRRRPRLAPWAFVFCGAALLCEVKGLIHVHHFEPRHPAPTFAPEWELARGEFRHLALYPPRCGDAGDVCCPGWSPRPRAEDVYLALHAARLGLTFNGGGVARAFRSRLEDACRSLQAEVADGQLDRLTIYAVAGSEEARFRAANPRAPCRRLDGELVCVAPDVRGRFRDDLVTR